MVWWWKGGLAGGVGGVVGWRCGGDGTIGEAIGAAKTTNSVHGIYVRMVKLNGGIEFVVKQTAPTATARSTLEVEKYIEDTLS